MPAFCPSALSRILDNSSAPPRMRHLLALHQSRPAAPRQETSQALSANHRLRKSPRFRHLPPKTARIVYSVPPAPSQDQTLRTSEQRDIWSLQDSRRKTFAPPPCRAKKFHASATSPLSPTKNKIVPLVSQPSHTPLSLANSFPTPHNHHGRTPAKTQDSTSPPFFI